MTLPAVASEERLAALFLNLGDEARAEEFLRRRISQSYDGTVIKSFDTPTSYVDSLRSRAVPESEARAFPDRPFIVDVNKAVDQFGLRPSLFPELVDSIVPGSRRVH